MYVLSTEQMKESEDGGRQEGGGGQQVVVKPVISAGEFHVSKKKLHLKKIGDGV